MTEAEDNKAERKASAATVNDKKAYEETAFGRRRISKMPKTLATLIRLAGIPILSIYRRVRRRSERNLY
jgi:hypothetical protein